MCPFALHVHTWLDVHGQLASTGYLGSGSKYCYASGHPVNQPLVVSLFSRLPILVVSTQLIRVGLSPDWKRICARLLRLCHRKSSPVLIQRRPSNQLQIKFIAKKTSYSQALAEKQVQTIVEVQLTRILLRKIN